MYNQNLGHISSRISSSYTSKKIGSFRLGGLIMNHKIVNKVKHILLPSAYIRIRV